jgi:glucose/arabinose dehydrogenase
MRREDRSLLRGVSAKGGSVRVGGIGCALRRVLVVGGLTAGLGGAGSAAAQQNQPDIGVAPVMLGTRPYVFDTAEQHKIRVSVVVRGLPHPFSVAFLPNGDALVSERGAHLRLVHHATSGTAMLDPTPVPGAPAPAGFRGGGLHDVVLHPKYADNHWVYFTYNKPGAPIPDAKPPGRRQTAVALGRGVFDGKALTHVQELFVGEFQTGSSGSRIAFGRDGLVYMTTGAPFNEAAQQLGSVYGKVLRLREDGSIPADNPFVKRAGARPEVFSYGHRDQLGLTIDPKSGAVIAAEHGPNGGDEINLILPGRNYGWPNYSFGRSYEGPRISALPVVEGIEQPIVLWLPSIAPTGLAFYTGDRFPAWKGNLFIGSARIGEIPRTGGLERVVFNDKLEELRRERLLGELHQRIRDVRQGPDGLLYVITDEDDGALLRIEPTVQ